ncbi:MAG TPA: hypothetical protein VGX78_21575 [Pirellulales bacterium]|jgi:hypothetical protein|nr:hypothetical protein [Pirellulales bacterium]
MLLFSFHGLQPKWLTSDRFYKVYVTGDSLYVARVACQFFDWRSAAIQLLVFAPLAYGSIRGRRQREAL